VLIEAGLQEPATPLVETDGRTGAAEPIQSVPIGLKDGVIEGVTVIVIVPFVPHCPTFGVNV